MAIAKTVFTGATYAANAAEVYAFLNANKSGYFNSVTKDSETNLITCTANGVDCLKLGFDSNTRSIIITAANSTTKSNWINDVRWEYAYATSKGLWLYSRHTVSGTDLGMTYSVFITKTDTDKIALVSIFGGQYIGNMDFVVADVMTDNVFTVFSGGINVIFFDSGLTTLTQIPLTQNGTSYAPYLYITQFAQYRDVPSVLTVGTSQYVYDGRIALKE